MHKLVYDKRRHSKFWTKQRCIDAWYSFVHMEKWKTLSCENLACNASYNIIIAEDISLICVSTELKVSELASLFDTI